MNNHRDKLVVFASVPPPKHGQSVMIEAMLSALDQAGEEYHHIDARWSDEATEIGGISFGKIRKIFTYVLQAFTLVFKGQGNVLYYVPGPVKWSAVVRDWIVLGVLRIFYSKTIFHWHAIGQGEWAHHGVRQSLPGPLWVDRIARLISRLVLRVPHRSIAVCEGSTLDAQSVSSREIIIVNNGIPDPFPEFSEDIVRQRLSTRAGRFRLLFLSRGTVEKGILDAIKTAGEASKRLRGEPAICLTLAGGIDSEIQEEVTRLYTDYQDEQNQGWLQIETRGFVDREEKVELLRAHDLFLFPSHWESFGLVAVEAMAAGLPVVGYASDGAKGVLGKNSHRVVPVGDVPGLTNLIIQETELLDKEEAIKVSVNLRMAFQESFSQKRFDVYIYKALAS